MIKRALAGQPAELMFTKDYREFLRGDLAHNHKVRINFDAERLPQVFDVAGASLEAHVLFHKDAAERVIPLESHTGILTRKSGVEPGAGSMVTAVVQIPADAERFSPGFAGRGLGPKRHAVASSKLSTQVACALMPIFFSTFVA